MLSPTRIDLGSAFPPTVKAIAILLLVIALSSSLAFEERFLFNPFLYICLALALHLIFSKRRIEIINQNNGQFQLSVGIGQLRYKRNYKLTGYRCALIKSGKYRTNLKQIGPAGGLINETSTSESLYTLYLIPQYGEKLKLFQGDRQKLQLIIQALISPCNFDIYIGAVRADCKAKFV